MKTEEPHRALGTCQTDMSLCVGEHDGTKPHPRWNTCLRWEPLNHFRDVTDMVEKDGKVLEPHPALVELYIDFLRTNFSPLECERAARFAQMCSEIAFDGEIDWDSVVERVRRRIEEKKI